MKFSIIVVCLNAGEKLNQTLDSVLCQTFGDYEIIVKDGGSRDGSIEGMQRDGRVRLFVETDSGIYDAMNQAVTHVQGEYVLFLNCGDVLYDEKVLARTADAIERYGAAQGGNAEAEIFYGDTYSGKNDVLIPAPPFIDGFTCYRNIPCHQSCFYAAQLVREKPYDLQYRIRADYDHFLWCFYKRHADMVYLEQVVSAYEGGGFSESRENRQRDKAEHRAITERYLSKRELFKYRGIMLLTLAPLRRFLAENPLFSGLYHWLKKMFYKGSENSPRKFSIWRAVLALLFLLCWSVILLRPEKGMLREDGDNFLTGEGMWELESSGQPAEYCQIFVPQYENLESIGLIFSYPEESAEGSFRFLICDRQSEIIFEQDYSYEEIKLNEYIDIYVDRKVEPGREYYMYIMPGVTSDGITPSLKICGKEYYLAENVDLMCGTDMLDAQLVTAYHYARVLKKDIVWKAYFLLAIACLLIVLGLPKNNRIRLAIQIALLVLVPYVLGGRLEAFSGAVSRRLPYAQLANILLMYLLELIVLLLSGSGRFAIVFTSFFLTFLYSLNYYVASFRGSPLRWNDLKAAGTAAQVVKNYSVTPNPHIAMAWCIMFVAVVCGLQAGMLNCKKRVKGRLISGGIGLILMITAGYLLLYTPFLEDIGFPNYNGRWIHYETNGYLVSSCLDFRNSQIVKPQGYSTQEVEAVLERYQTEKEEPVPKDPPSIIMIMNESFSDLRVLGNLELSEENMPFFNSLQENTVRGWLDVSVLGGGTANTEFEVFTGCSMAFLPASGYAYEQYVSRPSRTMVSTLRDRGYHTVSMHPEKAGNWNRFKIYDYFGFEQSLWKEDFEGAEHIHSGVSDRETYKKVEEIFDGKEEGKPIFIFDLTMQNHGGYSKDIPVTVSVQNVERDDATDNYLSLIKESDDAFREMIRYFEQQDERVIVCMFGDHQPQMWDSFYQDISAKTKEISQEEMNWRKYRTPFVIWSNYDTDAEADVEISANYLGVLLLGEAGVADTPYFSFLREQMETYPIITVNGYGSKDHIVYGSVDGDDLMENRYIQYNYLFDQNIVEWGF